MKKDDDGPYEDYHQAHIDLNIPRDDKHNRELGLFQKRDFKNSHGHVCVRPPYSQYGPATKANVH